MKNFPTLEEMRTMSEVRLRNLDITTKEEENLLQLVVYERFINAPLEVHRDGMVDVKTPQEEAELQAKVDKDALDYKNRVTSGMPQFKEPVEKEVEILESPEKDSTDEKPKVKCQVCGSKISRHKPGCPEIKQ